MTTNEWIWDAKFQTGTNYIAIANRISLKSKENNIFASAEDVYDLIKNWKGFCKENQNSTVSLKHFMHLYV